MDTCKRAGWIPEAGLTLRFPNQTVAGVLPVEGGRVNARNVRMSDGYPMSLGSDRQVSETWTEMLGMRCGEMGSHPRNLCFECGCYPDSNDS